MCSKQTHKDCNLNLDDEIAFFLYYSRNQRNKIYDLCNHNSFKNQNISSVIEFLTFLNPLSYLFL